MHGARCQTSTREDDLRSSPVQAAISSHPPPRSARFVPALMLKHKNLRVLNKTRNLLFCAVRQLEFSPTVVARLQATVVPKPFQDLQVIRSQRLYRIGLDLTDDSRPFLRALRNSRRVNSRALTRRGNKQDQVTNTNTSRSARLVSATHAIGERERETHAASASHT